MRSLDDFYKYIEKEERALRERAGSRPEAPPPSPPEPEPAPPATLVKAEEEDPAEEVPQAQEDVPPPAPPARNAMEGFVPPPLPPKRNLPSRYESILPPGTLPLSAAKAVTGEGAAPNGNGHKTTVEPAADVRYTLRGGVTVPVRPEEEIPLPDIEAYIPALRDPDAEDAPAAPVTTETAGLFAEPMPGQTASDPPDYLPPIVEEEPTQVADAPARPRRPRRAASAPLSLSEGEAAALWGRLPRHIQLLVGMSEPQEEVAQKYYTRGFKETRRQLIERLLDPTLTLEDTARVLGVCPTTVRRYTNRGVLPHHRTVGQQRRFRLSDVLAFLEQQSLRRAGGPRGAGQATAEGDADA